MFRNTPIALIAVLLFASGGHGAETKTPNIVFILADDLGYETIGANGGQSYKTPNLDRMAATGMRFERCYVQPLCTPTRVQLMTGMYNVRNYIEFGTMDPHATTFGNLLKNAGYMTAIAGKWQLGHDKDLPRRFGFDEACLWQHTRRPPRYANPGLEYNGVERDFNHGEYGPDLVSDFALDFITRHKSQPFFLYYPMMLTHAPFQPTPDSPDWDPKASGEKAGKNVKHFADMVAYMDKLVGKLVTKVDELGLRDNTLIIFLGDNGTGKGVTSRFRGSAYDGGKGLTTAAGMHVPLIANWPGHVPSGGVNDDLIDSTDFLPTLCAAAGTNVPSALTIDGHSFLPQLLGEKGQPREWIYSWYSQDGKPPFREFAMDAKYKLYRSGRFIGLGNDPLEARPQSAGELKGAEAAAAAKLKKVLAQYANARPAELLSSPDNAKKAKKKDRPTKAGRKKRKQARSASDE
jgi:arylsulfatase A